MRIGVYGNLTLDELYRNGTRTVRPGGSALFASLTAAYLGARVSIVSNIGADYPEKFLSWIRQNRIDCSNVTRLDGHNTRFRISYRDGSRKLDLVYPGQRLRPRISSRPSRAIHLGPVFMETGLDTLNQARRNSKFLSVDVQGLVRSVDQKGRVRLVAKNIDPFLSKCNLVKATEEEVRVIAPARTLFSAARRVLRRGAEYVIITGGRSGSLLVRKDGRALRIPSFPESRIVDLTGAGDILLGGWLATFLFVGDPHWAGAVGAAFASLSVRGFGAAKFRIARRELFRRASWVYNNSRFVGS